MGLPQRWGSKCAKTQLFQSHWDLCFLDAPSHLYKRVSPSVGPSVHQLVGPSVRPLVRLSVRRSVRRSVTPSRRMLRRVFGLVELQTRRGRMSCRSQGRNSRLSTHPFVCAFSHMGQKACDISSRKVEASL